jgi:hypothetical protein
MRKLVYGGAAACLIVGALGVYLITHTGQTEPVLPTLAEEEQELPLAAPFPVGDMVRQASVGTNDDTSDVVEPIVVEGPVTEEVLSPQVVARIVAEIDPESEFGVEIGVQAPVTSWRRRPDEEPGKEQKMPNADQTNADAWLGARLWEALVRVLTGHEPWEVQPAQTQEPPVADEQTEPVMAPTLAPLFPPAMDYHHGQCTRYTERCPIPYFPVPPPPIREEK